MAKQESYAGSNIGAAEGKSVIIAYSTDTGAAEQSTADATDSHFRTYTILNVQSLSSLQNPNTIDPNFDFLYSRYSPNFSKDYAYWASFLTKQISRPGNHSSANIKWTAGFESGVFSKSWRETGKAEVLQYQLTGTWAKKRDFIMASLFDILRFCSHRLNLLEKTAMNSPRQPPSSEFLRSSEEVFSSSEESLGFDIQYNRARWAPLLILLRDPIARQFIMHCAMNAHMREVSKDEEPDMASLSAGLGAVEAAELTETMKQLKGVKVRAAPSEQTEPSGEIQVVGTLDDSIFLDLSPGEASSKKKNKKRNRNRKGPSAGQGVVPGEAVGEVESRPLEKLVLRGHSGTVDEDAEPTVDPVRAAAPVTSVTPIFVDDPVPSQQVSEEPWKLVEPKARKPKNGLMAGRLNQGHRAGLGARSPQKQGNVQKPRPTPVAKPSTAKKVAGPLKPVNSTLEKPIIVSKGHTPEGQTLLSKVSSTPIESVTKSADDSLRPQADTPSSAEILVTQFDIAANSSVDPADEFSNLDDSLHFLDFTCSPVKFTPLTDPILVIFEKEAPVSLFTQTTSQLIKSVATQAEDIELVDTIPSLTPRRKSNKFDPSSSQASSESARPSLVGVLMEAGVNASALTSLMTENSNTKIVDAVATMSAPNLPVGGAGSRSVSVGENSKSEDQIKVRSISDGAKSTSVAADYMPSTISFEKFQVTEQKDVTSSMNIEELIMKFTKHGEWVTEPTVTTYDGKNAYSILGDCCPLPLKLADHPELNKFLKPGFLFQCAYCQNETYEDMHSEKAIVCPGCGPCSDVRYCQKSHLLADVLDHQKICGATSGKFPMIIQMLPVHYQHLHPYLQTCKDPANVKFMNPECFRQMAYCMVVKRDAEIENPFLAFYNFKMSKKVKERCREYKNTVYEYVDSGNYYVFTLSTIPRGTSIQLVLNISDGCGPYFNRVRNAAFLLQNEKYAKVLYRKIKADLKTYPDKAFRDEVIAAFEIQFKCEFPSFDTSKAGYIGLKYDFMSEFKAIEISLRSRENDNPILHTWMKHPARGHTYDEENAKKWGTGWSGQSDEEWQETLNRKYSKFVMFALECQELGVSVEERKLQIMKSLKRIHELGLVGKSVQEMTEIILKDNIAKENAAAECAEEAKKRAAERTVVEEMADDNDDIDNAEYALRKTYIDAHLQTEAHKEAMKIVDQQNKDGNEWNAS